MWKTSFIQFLKIIRQNKFFTFLNLFGVSITMMIILIAAIKIESSIWPGGPEKNNKNMLFVNRQTITNRNSTSVGGINATLVKDYLAKMESPKAIGFSSILPWNYIGDYGIEVFMIRSTNAGWWKVFDYQFIEGRPFNEQEVLDAALVVVIDQKVKNKFFQDQKAAVGQMLEIEGEAYKVVGVIKNVPANCTKSNANVFKPYTLSPIYNSNVMWTGPFDLALLCDRNGIPKTKLEIESIRQRIIPMLDEGYTTYLGGPTGPIGSYLRNRIYPHEYKGDNIQILNMLGKILLLMLLPALNLISLQLIRIHERSEEIGVRKAFGASRMELIKQILYENTLLTFLGAVLGLVLTLIIVYGFRNLISQILFSGYGQNIQLQINFGLFFVILLSSMVLSLVSGIIPAIKMSRLQAVEVLKGGEL